jgi:hypothetical protein
MRNSEGIHVPASSDYVYPDADFQFENRRALIQSDRAAKDPLST